jgi:hypothetical protein
MVDYPDPPQSHLPLKQALDRQHLQDSSQFFHSLIPYVLSSL